MNGTSSNSSCAPKVSSNATIDANSVASVYPYWRATREKKASKYEEEEKKPYEPRPAKFKENYEDKGLNVFKPDFDAVRTITSDTFSEVGPNSPKLKKGKKT